MKIKVVEYLQTGILAALGPDGTILVNSKHLVDIGELAYDDSEECKPLSEIPAIFMQAMENYYAS